MKTHPHEFLFKYSREAINSKIRFKRFNYVNIKDPDFKTILKYKSHPGILAVQKYNKSKIFHFEEVKIGEIEKEIPKLDKTKASQECNIPTRIIKKNIDIFAEFICTFINGAIKSASFPFFLKVADFTPLHKKGRRDMK